MIEAVAHQKTEPSLPSPVALGFSDAVMIILTIGHVASSIFLEIRMIIPLNPSFKEKYHSKAYTGST